MDMIISKNHYESLVNQIESDFNNLKKSFELLKKNVSDKKLILEHCRNYAFLCQDLKYLEKLTQNISLLELPIHAKTYNNLDEIKILHKKVKWAIYNK